MKSENNILISDVIDLTDANFKSVVLESNKNFIVEVSADWSGECFLMSRTIEQCAKLFHSQIEFGRVNIDMNEKVAGEYGITELPFILFFRKGELLHHEIGLLSAQSLIRDIKRIYSLQ